MDVSIIVVNYNTCKLTTQCLESIFRWTSDIEFEVILVDNHSDDDSVNVIKRKYPSVKIVENRENLGFGCANNIGAKNAAGKYLFLLNSDTILVENVVKTFFDFLEKHNEYVSCGCNLVNAEGTKVPTHGCLPTLKMELANAVSRLGGSDYNNNLSLAQTIDYGNLSNPGYIAGADIFIRSSAFHQVGGFDPHIFMYFEETDIYARLRRFGYKSCILPDSKIIHLVGGSMNNSSINSSINYNRIMMFEKSRLYYYRKNNGIMYASIVKTLRIIYFLRLLKKNNKRNLMSFIIKYALI